MCVRFECAQVRVFVLIGFCIAVIASESAQYLAPPNDSRLVGLAENAVIACIPVIEASLMAVHGSVVSHHRTTLGLAEVILQLLDLTIGTLLFSVLARIYKSRSAGVYGILSTKRRILRNLISSWILRVQDLIKEDFLLP